MRAVSRNTGPSPVLGEKTRGDPPRSAPFCSIRPAAGRDRAYSTALCGRVSPAVRGRGSGGHRLGVDADLLAVLAAPLKDHVAVDLGKQRIVLAQADVDTGVDARPPLAHEDAPGRHILAAKPLDAQSLGNAVPAVLGAAAGLLGGKQLQVTDKRHGISLPLLGCRFRLATPGLVRRRPPCWARAPRTAPAPAPGTAAALPAVPGPWWPARSGRPGPGCAHRR